MVAAMNARHQRSEFATGRLVSADHDLMAGPALGLGPALGTARTIGRIQSLRDHPFELELAGRPQHGIPAALEMLDVADLVRALPATSFQEFLEPRLAF